VLDANERTCAQDPVVVRRNCRCSTYAPNARLRSRPTEDLNFELKVAATLTGTIERRLSLK
jgi:hypothetical protein